MSKKLRAKPEEYNTEMISDFIEHLMWEMRISIHETDHPGVENPELTEQLTRFIKKRGSILPVYHFNGTPEEASELRQKTRENYQRMLSALEALEPILGEALATIPKKVVLILKYPECDGLHDHTPPWKW